MKNAPDCPNDCPTESRLRDFSVGALPPQQIEQIALHLARSPHCACHAVLISLESDGDRLLEFLSKPAPFGPYEREAGCSSAIARAASLSSQYSLAQGAHVQDAASRTPPAALGPYRDLEWLGRGGMGDVFRAFDERLGRPVAIKIIRQDRFIDESGVMRFCAEAETAARLDHPNVVPIYEVNEVDQRRFIVMKLIDGRPLSELADQCWGDLRRTIGRVATVARAIHFAHQRQVLHRDLKPSNILIDRSGTPYVSDFGLAKRLDVETQLTQTGAILGTPGYMAPEQAVGKEDDVTSATDIYGLGGILYFTLTGHAPFEGNQPLEVLRRVVDAEPMSPSAWNRQVDRDLETICLKCLSKDPGQRYGSASAFADDLERWIRGEPILARPLGWPQRIVRWCRRRPLSASLAGLAALLTIVVSIGSPFAVISIHRHSLETKRNLFASQIALARAERQSDRADHRRAGLAAVRGALSAAAGFEMSPSQTLAARNEAIVALAFPDIYEERTRQIPSPYPTFDSPLNHYAYSNPSGEIVLHRLDDGEEVVRFEASAIGADSSEISPSSRYLAAFDEAPDARGITVYSAKSGKRLWFAADAGQNPIIRFSPNGDLIALGASNTELRVFESESGNLVTEFIHAQTEKFHYRWHPDGESIAIADGTKTLRSFNIKTGKVQMAFELPEAIRFLVWRADGKMLAAVAWENIHLFDVVQQRVLRTFREHGPEPVVGLSYAPDGRLLASCTHSRVTNLWSPETGQVLARIPGRFPKFSTASGRLVTVGSHGGTHAIRLWQLAPPRELNVMHIEGAREEFLETIATSSDGNQLAATSGGGLRVWQLPSMTQVEEISLPRAFGLAALAEPGGWLINCREGTLVVEIDASSDRSPELTAVSQNMGNVRYFQLAAGSNGNRIAAVIGPGKLGLVDRQAGLRHELQTGHDETPVAVSPDGNLVISAIDRQTSSEIVAWDFATGKRIGKIGDCGRGYVKICFSQDGRRLVVGCAVHYRCWQHKAKGPWRLLYTVPRSELGMWGACAFSPDGQILAAVDTQRLIKLRDAATGKEFCTLRSPAPQPNISHLAFSADGTTLFVAGENQLLQAWNLALLRDELAALNLDW